MTTLSRRTFVKAALAAPVAAAILPTGLGGTLAAAAAREDEDGPKETIVLVHGGWADSSSWTAVIERLQDEGYTVVAPANPLRDLHGDASYLSSVLSTLSGPIVLVGH